MNYNSAELMSIVISRALREGDVMITGTNAAITCSAAFVAQECDRPRVSPVIGAFGTVDPKARIAPLSGGDQRFLPGRVTTSLAGVVADQVRGLADVICLGGLQVDRLGHVNLAVIGDYENPEVRGPGTIGVSLIATLRRAILYFVSHDPRTFVESVDFVGANGLRENGGIEIIVTPLAVLGPVEDGSRIDLISIHPGVNFDEVQARTGFPLDRSRAKTTPEPTESELAALSRYPDGATLRDMELVG